VIDFGLARYSIGSSVPNEAGEIEIKGTGPYMPPERHTGKEPLTRPPGYPHADQFAFCVSLWELLYGVRPYAGGNVPALLESIEAGKFEMGLVGATVVPDAVRDVLKRGLSARLSDRPQSMDELLRALADAAEGASARRARWRRRVEVGLAVALAVACVFMAAMLMDAPKPELSAVEQTLASAVDQARDGNPDAAVQLLEAARTLAAGNDDTDALRRVAAEAIEAGHVFLKRGDRRSAGASWVVAYDAFLDLGDKGSSERISKMLADVDAIR